MAGHQVPGCNNSQKICHEDSQIDSLTPEALIIWAGSVATATVFDVTDVWGVCFPIPRNDFEMLQMNPFHDLQGPKEAQLTLKFSGVSP